MPSTSAPERSGSAAALRGARVSITVGPGHHGGEIVDALLSVGALHRAIRYWPDFAVDKVDRGGAGAAPAGGAPRPGATLRQEVILPSYRRSVRLLQGLWRRLPGPLFADAPRLPTYALFDRLARGYVDGCDLFIGFSQLSRDSLRRARDLGARTLLEHPMCHARAYDEAVEREYRVSLLSRGSNGRYSRALLRRMDDEYQAAGHISVLSSHARSTFLRAGVPAERLLCLPVGVDAERFSPAPADPAAEDPRRPLRVLCVARLELMKGVQHLLSAFRRLRGPRARELCLIGPQFPEMLPHLQRHGGPDVHLVGNVPREELPRWYRSADLFCFPTLSDGFGLVLLEAMACGVPAVCTTASGGPDVIRDGDSGLLVPPGSAEALADRLQLLLDDGERRRAMGARARAAVLAGYTLPQYRRRILAAYGALLGGTPTRPEEAGEPAPRP